MMDSSIKQIKMAAAEDSNVNERLERQADLVNPPPLHQESGRADQAPPSAQSPPPLPAVSPARHQPAHPSMPRPRQPRTLSRTRRASGLSPEAAETVPRFLRKITNAPKRKRVKPSAVRKPRMCRRDLSSRFQAMAESANQDDFEEVDVEWLMDLSI